MTNICAALFCILTPVVPFSLLAGVNTAPDFDATPVELPLVDSSTPRPMTSMDLLMLRDLHGSQLSPDGKWVAFILGQAVYESNSYRSGLFVIGTTPGSKPVSLGSAGPPHWDDIGQWWPEDPQWSKDSSRIYYRMRRGGAWQVWEWKRTGGAPTEITHAAHDVLNFRVSEDGKTLVLNVATPS